MDNIKTQLQAIIEQADCDKPACRNCVSYKNGGCSFGCLNEKVKITSPNYSCDNFSGKYVFNENTVAALRDLLNDVKRVEEGVKNFELLLNGKIDEKEFVEIVD